MKLASVTGRLVLGILFVVFGANKLFHFVTVPMPSGDAGLYYRLLFTHHVMAVVALVELLGGLLLLVGRYVPLGLVLLGPVVANILLYHLLFDTTRIALGLITAALELMLLWAYRHSFYGVLADDATPA